MFNELSLNVLDVAENGIKAGAKLVTIRVTIDESADSLGISIEDDGSGMDQATLARVCDPFFTSRTTRKVGLGVSFFKQAAEMTGGSFEITSEVGKGTKNLARFVLSSIDRQPLGDLPGSIHTLAVYNQRCDFLYEYSVNGKSFLFDTREMREILEGVPFDNPEVSRYIKDYLTENTAEINADKIF